jgi:hypothetical protein
VSRAVAASRAAVAATKPRIEHRVATTPRSNHIKRLLPMRQESFFCCRRD